MINVYFRKDTYAAYGFVTQYVQVTGYDIGTSDGTANQLFILPDDYAQGSLDVQVGGVYWNRVDTLGFSSPTDTDFMVALKPDGALYLVFGDGVNGYIPDDSLTIVGNYKSTQGATINVGMGQIISIISSLSLPAGSGTLKVTNPSKSFGAKNVEGMEDLRRAIPLSIRTLDRAVTRQDYIDVALMAPGVRAAVLAFDCGLGVTLYIVPNGGGVANASFLDEVKEFVEAKAIATIPIQTKPSGETRIRLKVRVTGKYRITANLIRTKVLQRLESLYDPYKTSINQSIRVSDIIAAIDNLPEVDFLTMDYIYAVPYLRPSNLALDLEYRATIKSTSINSFTWRLVYSSSASTFTLFKNGVQVQADMTVGVYSNIAGILDFELMSIPPDIVNADYWEFTTYPYNRDIEITDRSIPVIYPEDVVLEIKEQYV